MPCPCWRLVYLQKDRIQDCLFGCADTRWSHIYGMLMRDWFVQAHLLECISIRQSAASPRAAVRQRHSRSVSLFRLQHILTAHAHSFAARHAQAQSDEIMIQREHGTCIAEVQSPLRWNCDWDKADQISCFNRSLFVPFQFCHAQRLDTILCVYLSL